MLIYAPNLYQPRSSEKRSDAGSVLILRAENELGDLCVVKGVISPKVAKSAQTANEKLHNFTTLQDAGDSVANW